MTRRKSQRRLVVLGNFATELESSTHFKFCVPIVIKRQSECSRCENKVRLKEERVLIQNFTSIAALRDLNRCGERATVAKQIAVADLHAGECPFVGVESHPKTKFLAFGLLCRDVEAQQMSIDWDRLDLKQVELASLHERPKSLVQNIRAIRFAL